jgi:hypothetical protein
MERKSGIVSPGETDHGRVPGALIGLTSQGVRRAAGELVYLVGDPRFEIDLPRRS